MNLLHRVFYGRVAKSRPASTDRHRANTPETSSRRPTQSQPVRSPVPRAGAFTAPSMAPVPSTRHDQSLHVGEVSVPKVRVKEEDETDDFPLAFAQDDDRGSMSHNIRADEHVANSDESDVDTLLDTCVKEESSKQGSVEEDSAQEASYGEVPENVEGQSDEDDADEEGFDETGPDCLSSDVPMPSIEEDNSHVEEEEQLRSLKKTPPFLHGRTHRTDLAPASNSEDGGDEEIEDEDFEEELIGEHEEDLLIDDNDLRYWLHHKRSTAGIQEWPSEACRLYKLLFLRGLYPMFGSQWTWNFLDHPMPGELFTPLNSDDKALLKVEKSDIHASKALIRLFNLYGYVSDFRQYGDKEKIAPLIQKEIKRFVLWAERDGDFVKKRDYVSPVFVIIYKDAQAASTGRPIVQKCQKLVEKYRSKYAARGIQHYPRCIHIFVVVQHIVLVMVADTEHPDEDEPYPLAELDLSQRSHWLDYSLGIAVTVMLAKESLMAHRWAFPTIEVVESDPDL